MKEGENAANILAGRFNPLGKFIRAWNGDSNIGWMIIDCMMNIPLLYWMSGENKDPRFKSIALMHADTAMEKLVRPDGSCNHIGIMDPLTGDLLEAPQRAGVWRKQLLEQGTGLGIIWICTELPSYQRGEVSGHCEKGGPLFYRQCGHDGLSAAL